ncbi:MAG: ferrous iron transport protein B [Clostridiales bacterium]|jgi:ferrous iron transport protein B|nr:ferrous iron transport protein B [Clostridiales bacterium]
MKIALIGNQNCGKTTLFNCLTGSYQHVGNFPGITVEKKIGRLKHDKNIEIVDLPGIYSLSPYSAEEILTRDFLIKNNSDIILNIIDATNIERNLYLTLQILELNLPTIIALNMIDELKLLGNSVNISELENILKVKIIPITASKKEGIADLIYEIKKIIQENKPREKIDVCNGEVHKAIHSVAHIIEDHAQKKNISSRFAALKIIQNDELMIDYLKLDNDEIKIIDEIINSMKNNLNKESDIAVVDMYYNFIEKICKNCVIKNKNISQKSIDIDKILTHKFFALPIFLLIMSLIFFISFYLVGGFLTNLLSLSFEVLKYKLQDFLIKHKTNELVRSLVIDGAFQSLISILSFLPMVSVLFFLLSILEDSGYMARVAFFMDAFLRKIGLSGKSFVPMLIGFGCSVPAIMSTRTLLSNREKKITIFLIPFMSCSAKIPIYIFLTSLIFSKLAIFIIILLYLSGIIIAVITSLFLKKNIMHGKPMPFLLELPPYRMPTKKNLALHARDKIKDFLSRAFSIIFVSSIFIWILEKFDFHFRIVEDKSNSILACFSKFISPIFKPLGFGHWMQSCAIASGLIAKETVLTTLLVLCNGDNNKIKNLFDAKSAFCFLLFIVLYTPCIAAISTIHSELKSTTKTFICIVSQLFIAWITTFVFYNIFFDIDKLLVMLMLTFFVLSFKKIINKKICTCHKNHCDRCHKNKK